MLPVHIAVLAALFAVFTDPSKPGTWLVGLVVGGAVALAFGGRSSFDGGRPGLRLLVRLPLLVAATAVRMAAGAWTMLAILLGRRGWQSAGLVDCAHCTETEEGLVVLGLIESASPGSLTVGMDPQNRSLLIHTVDAGDPEATCAAVHRFYRRHQARVLP